MAQGVPACGRDGKQEWQIREGYMSVALVVTGHVRYGPPPLACCYGLLLWLAAMALLPRLTHVR